MDTWILYLVIFILVILGVCTESHDPVRFYGKYFVFYGFTSIICLLVTPYYLHKVYDVTNIIPTSLILKQITKLLGIEWELRGADELEIQRGCVIVANHQSSIDVLGMFNIWKVMGRCTALAKKEIFYVWPFGLTAWLTGIVFIDRKDRQKTINTMNETASSLKSSKTKLWIFPEGTRNKKFLENGLLPFKKGAFRIAIDHQIPILPVVYSPYYFIDSDTYFFGRGKAVIQTLKAIPMEGLQIEDIDDLMDRTRKAMQEAIDNLAREVLAPLPMEYPGLTSIKNKQLMLRRISLCCS